MDKNSNFYKAIEEAIIRPQSEKLKGLEDTPHEFSQQYNKKIAEAEIIACGDKSAKKASGVHRKISVKTFSIIAAAALLAGAVTVTASESARRMIYRIFKGSEDKVSYSSVVESTDLPVVTQSVPNEPVTCTSVTAPVTILSTSGTTVQTTVTSVTAVSTVSGEYYPLTSVTATNPVPVYHGINAHQQPSMMAPSIPTTLITTAPAGSENQQTGTTINNSVMEGGDSTRITTISPTSGDEHPVKTMPATITRPTESTSIVTVTSIVAVTTLADGEVKDTMPPSESDPLPSLTDDETDTDISISTEQTQEPTSDLTYTTTIKLK